MIVFLSGGVKHTLDDSVKDWSFEKLEEVFKGKLDYKSLAKQLGIKPTPKPKTKPKD
jgi:hypothetical protein